MLLSAQSLEKRYGAETVFSDISFTLDEGHRVALVGKNGAGKSTLMKLLVGKTEPDAGRVTVTDGRTVAYLPQEIAADDTRTGIAYLQDGTNLQPHQFFPLLEGLGVPQEVAERSLNGMSGGQQTKILLTRFLLEPSDILLLDEPTNNLDIPSLLWLERFLASSKKAMIIISHDLMFLNTVANRVFEMKDGTLLTERGTYGDYLERKKKELARAKKEYAQYIQKVRQLERTKRQIQGKGGRIDAAEADDGDKIGAGAARDRASAGQRQARSIERRIQRMEKVKKPFEEDPYVLTISARQQDGDIEIAASDLVVGYPGGVRVGPVSFSVKIGDRLCLMGMNGAGKSTLLKTVAGMLEPLEGGISVSDGVLFGDLMQKHERADPGTVALDFFMQQTGGDAERAMHALKQAGFTDRMLRQRIAGLSSGMRARLLFAVFVALGVNVLILDEPTNHLDMEAVAALKDLLKQYTGIVFLVSHNRWFLEDLNVGTYYSIADSAAVRIPDFEKYLSDAQARAERMVKQLRRAV